MGLIQSIRRRFSDPVRRLSREDRQRVAMLNAKLRERMHAAINARYDAATQSDGFKNYWAAADRYDADSAHSKEVRHTLVSRSRYELGNNGYACGIARTYATDLVGVGPSLRMQTATLGFNQMVERQWNVWAKEVQLRRKLWCMAHARYGDGESFGIVRRNPRLKHPVKLDLRLYETEQIQTPSIPFDEPGYIDGIKFDEFGNPIWYDVLPRHPGGTSLSGSAEFNIVPERVPAEFVLHWFRLERPGQHRAVPEAASTLNTGAAGRRFREAVLAAAEVAATITAILHTTLSPNEQPEDFEFLPDFDTMEMAHRLMMALPEGYDAKQMEAKHPNAAYEAFHKLIINEQARPCSMPFNKAACDSSSYNYASGRLDHQTYYGELDTVREDGNDLALDKLFGLWFVDAVKVFGWLGGAPENIGAVASLHAWDWPKHRVADVEAEANANQTKLKSGQIGLRRLYSEAGLDLDDEIAEMATTFGVDDQAVRQRLLDVILPAPKSGTRERDLVEAIQKIYLGVGVVISPEEAREILNRNHGAALSGPAPKLSRTPQGGNSQTADATTRFSLNGNGSAGGHHATT